MILYCIDGKAILHEVTIKEPPLPSLAGEYLNIKHLHMDIKIRGKEITIAQVAPMVR